MAFDLQGELKNIQGATGAASEAVIPLWKTAPMQPKIVRRGGRSTEDMVGVQATRVVAGPAYGSNAFVNSDTAESAWMDLSESDRMEFLSMAKLAGLVPKKNISPADLASAWAKAVSAAKGYNSQRPDKDKWISPWEAVKKLSGQMSAAMGGIYDGEAAEDEFPRTTRTSQTRKKSFTVNDLRSSAEEILKDTLGRSPSEAEMAAYVASVQRAYDANPERVTTTTTALDDIGNANSVQEITGGVDPTPIITQAARGNPEYARAQAGMQYLPALMQALSAPV